VCFRGYLVVIHKEINSPQSRKAAKPQSRKAAKSAKCLIVFVKELLCVLCVSAVKTVFMDGHYLPGLELK
jgi:hypothetical protein